PGEARQRSSPPLRPGTSHSGTSPSGAPPSETAPAGVTARSRRPVEVGAQLDAAVGGGLLPSAGGGLGVAPFVGLDRFHARLTAQYWARRTIDVDPGREATVELRLITGGVRLCPQLLGNRIRVPLCGGVDAGAVLGQGTGSAIVDARSGWAPWVGAVLQPGVELALTPWLSLGMAVEGVISLRRPAFVVEGAARAFTMGPAGLRGRVGLSLHRPRKRP
ncbi:MAG: hypothetical protein KDK70_41380, partial [Myxococcales bacterium]|nr:hypothetical protein [Myxococcales bacterium]